MEQNIIQKLKTKYQNRLDKIDYKNIDNRGFSPNIYLFQKWAYKIPKGWYGFDGIPCMEWAYIIDEFLEYLLKECPDLEILQQKLKFGGYRCYVNLPNITDKNYNRLQNEIKQMENWLFHKNLIY